MVPLCVLINIFIRSSKLFCSAGTNLIYTEWGSMRKFHGCDRLRNIRKAETNLWNLHIYLIGPLNLSSLQAKVCERDKERELDRMHNAHKYVEMNKFLNLFVWFLLAELKKSGIRRRSREINNNEIWNVFSAQKIYSFLRLFCNSNHRLLTRPFVHFRHKRQKRCFFFLVSSFRWVDANYISRSFP